MPYKERTIAENCPACDARPAFGAIKNLPQHLQAQTPQSTRFTAWVVCGCGGRPWVTRLKVKQPSYEAVSSAWNQTLNRRA